MVNRDIENSRAVDSANFNNSNPGRSFTMFFDCAFQTAHCCSGSGFLSTARGCGWRSCPVMIVLYNTCQTGRHPSRGQGCPTFRGRRPDRANRPHIALPPPAGQGARAFGQSRAPGSLDRRPIPVSVEGDPKGRYVVVASNGKIDSVTGVDGPDQAMEHTKITIPSLETTPEHQAQAIVKSLLKNGHI